MEILYNSLYISLKDVSVTIHVSGNIGNTFELHASLGTLTLRVPVDSTRLSEYMLTVQADDCGSPPLSSTVPVHILVIKADETVPRYNDISSQFCM